MIVSVPQTAIGRNRRGVPGSGFRISGSRSALDAAHLTPTMTISQRGKPLRPPLAKGGTTAPHECHSPSRTRAPGEEGTVAMFSRATRRRRGITLTEILIAIMILGVGLVSLATLFPIGLLRLRDATRYTRSATLLQSAASDARSPRALLQPVVHVRRDAQLCSPVRRARPHPVVLLADPGEPECLSTQLCDLDQSSAPRHRLLRRRSL